MLLCDLALQMFWKNIQKVLAWTGWLKQSTLIRARLRASYELYPSWVALKRVMSVTIDNFM